jgi:hypothetical protein
MRNHLRHNRKPKLPEILAAIAAITLIPALIAAAGCVNSAAQADRPPVPTPDVTAAVATINAIGNSEEQISEVRSTGAAILAESMTRGPVRSKLSPSTAGATIEIADRPVKLPDDVFIVDRIRFEHGGNDLDLPRWILGKGESTISVSQKTGEIGYEQLVNAPEDHFDELRRVISETVN